MGAVGGEGALRGRELDVFGGSGAVSVDCTGGSDTLSSVSIIMHRKQRIKRRNVTPLDMVFT